MKPSAQHTASQTTSTPVSDEEHLDSDRASDEALMIGIQGKEPAALDALYQRYRLLLKSVILRVVRSHASADDVMQECMLEIWHHATNYSSQKGTPLGWIVTLAKRRAIDHLRRQQTYVNARDRLQDDVWVHAGDRTHDAATDCEQADLGRILHQQLTRLPTPQQQVLRLAFLNGMSQREVAQATHTPLGTVKTRMELGLKKLRSAFRVCNAEHPAAASMHRA
jgi:RNA polymerase sigma-70 factor (ECF subfamily)